MAQQQQRQAGSPHHGHPTGRLLLAHIQTLQQHQQLGLPQVWGWRQGSSSASAGALRPASSRATFNEVATLALAADPASQQQQQQQQRGPDAGSKHSGSSSPGEQAMPSFKLPQQQLEAIEQQQQQQLAPFWQGQPHSKQHGHHHHHHHHHQKGPASGGVRHGGGSPQFASATISGGSGSGSGSDSPTGGLGRAVGRVLFNGEVCRLLGFVGAQLLVTFATLQCNMRQLQQQHGSGEQQQRPFAGWRVRMPWQRQDGAAGARGGDGAGGSGASSGSGGRSNAAWQAGEAAKQWVVRGIAAERALDLREALACYTNAVTLEPGNRDYLCRLAKQWSDLTYEDGATIEAIQEVNAKAIEYAERVIAMAPKSAGGYMASCVSRGRLALLSDNKTKVRLAKEAQEAARTAVDLEPGNDLAHHLMGRWHFEMAQINFVLRQLIRLVYGASLAPGTFEDALAEFSAAARLNPDKLIHRVELGRTHLRLGHKRDAYEHLTASMALEVEDINAKLQREDAEALLAKLRSELKKGSTELPASWGSFAGPGIVRVEDVTDSSSTASSADGSSGAVAAGSSSSSSSSGTA